LAGGRVGRRDLHPHVVGRLGDLRHRAGLGEVLFLDLGQRALAVLVGQQRVHVRAVVLDRTPAPVHLLVRVVVVVVCRLARLVDHVVVAVGGGGRVRLVVVGAVVVAVIGVRPVAVILPCVVRRLRRGRRRQ